MATSAARKSRLPETLKSGREIVFVTISKAAVLHPFGTRRIVVTFIASLAVRATFQIVWQ